MQLGDARVKAESGAWLKQRNRISSYKQRPQGCAFGVNVGNATRESIQDPARRLVEREARPGLAHDCLGGWDF